MRNFAVLGAAALLLALGVAQGSRAANQSGPAGPNIYSQAWQSGDVNERRQPLISQTSEGECPCVILLFSAPRRCSWRSASLRLRPLTRAALPARTSTRRPGRRASD